MQLSKSENLAYQELKKNNLVIFKASDIYLLLNIGKVKAYNLIKALKHKGAIKKAGKNFFALAGADDFVVGQAIKYPSYLSFWSALSYYGFSDQLPKKIFFATTKYSPEINNFKYVTLSKERFFGYTKISGLTIAEKEKAFIDSMLFPKYAGGIRIYKQYMESNPKKNWKRLRAARPLLKKKGEFKQKMAFGYKLLK